MLLEFPFGGVMLKKGRRNPEAPNRPGALQDALADLHVSGLLSFPHQLLSANWVTPNGFQQMMRGLPLCFVLSQPPKKLC